MKNKVLLKDYISTIESGTRGKGGASLEGVPSLGAEHLISDGTVNWDINKMKYIPDELFQSLKSGIVKQNDVLIVKDGATTGKTVYVDNLLYNKVAINEHIFLLRPDEKHLLSKYLFYYLHSKEGNRHVMANFRGATIGGITKTFINMPLPLPVISKQKEIISILDNIFSLICLKKRQLSKMDMLVKSRFVEMFGDPLKNSKNWPTDTLKSTCSKIGSGATPKGGQASYIEHGVSLIRSMNVHNGYFKYDDLAHINDEQAKQLNIVIVMENDILFNITGASVTRSCIVPNDVLPARVNQHVAIIRPNPEKVTSTFLNRVFLNDSYQHSLLNMAESNGATRQAITKQQLEMLIIPLPPIELQNQFTNFVNQINKSKVKVQKSLAKLEVLKKSLMQEYFG